ncbi:MAG: cupin, partial [Actinomycetota bacterium]|nr:cupin [Actinomycetota bacterium]
LTSGNGRITAQLGDRQLRMPASLAPAMTFVTEHRSFAVSDLAGLLNETSRTVLVRRLVREGLLMVAQ